MSSFINNTVSEKVAFTKLNLYLFKPIVQRNRKNVDLNAIKAIATVQPLG